MKEMRLKEDMDLTFVINTAFALLQMVDLVTTSVLDFCWQIDIYNLTIDLASKSSWSLLAVDVLLKTLRCRYQLKALAGYPLVRLPLIYLEWAFFTFQGI